MAVRMLLAMALLPLAAAKVQLPRWFGDNMGAPPTNHSGHSASCTPLTWRWLSAPPSLPAVFQLNAEYGARSFLNGKAAPGEKVVVKFNGQGSFPAVADPNGDWEVQFNGGGVRCGTEDCGNVTVTGESDGDTHVAKNVVAGDVIFCSGQSNSEQPATSSATQASLSAPPTL